MKKNVLGSRALYAAVLAVVACALWGCKPEPDTGKNDTAWLVGSWANAVSGASFTIKDDLTFECDIYPQPGQKARVRGYLDNSNSKLGQNEFILQALAAAQPGDPDNTYTGNAIMPKGMLDGFSGSLVIALTPADGSNTKFSFTSNSPAADQFFGGDYTKQQ